ncbi:MAG: hypothetical protein JWO36_6280 [Myxococcales bacterium]|nr:hypothetical protein [Myxococcales bacterium]
MNLKTLLTSLVLGSAAIASTASASPMHGQRFENRSVDHNDRTVSRPVVRDHQMPVNVGRAQFDRGQVARSRNDNWNRRPQVEARWNQRRPIIERPIIRPYVRPVYQRPIYQPVYQPIYHPTYVSQAISPFTNGQLFLGLGGAAANGVELTSDGGSTFIQQVAIRYLDGRTQVLEVGQSLDANNPSLDLQTDGSAISGVTIYGQGAAVYATAL